VRPPDVVVFSPTGDVTSSCRTCRDGAAGNGESGRVQFALLDATPPSADRHTTSRRRTCGRDGVDRKSGAVEMRAVAADGLPAGVRVDDRPHRARRGLDAWRRRIECPARAVIGGIGALPYRCSCSARCPPSSCPRRAVASILNTFTLVWALTCVTMLDHRAIPDRTGRLGVAIDYALLMISASATSQGRQRRRVR
jgi:hypothetical protein